MEKSSEDKVYIRESLYSRMTVVLFAIAPLMDTLNGMAAGMGFSVGQIYRAFLLCWLFFAIRYVKKYIFFPLLFVLCVFLFLTSLHLLMTTNQYGEELSYHFMWIFSIMISILILLLIKMDKVNDNICERVLCAWSWLFPCTILIPKFLGLGSYMYHGRIGYKGFYLANNGVSFLAAILVIYVGIHLLEKITISNVAKFFMIVSSCVIMSTKSAVLAVPIAMVVGINRALKIDFKKGIMKLVGILLIVGPPLVVIGTYVYKYLSDNLVARWTAMARINSTSLLDTALSGRWSKAEEIAEYFFYDPLLSFSFGIGRWVKIAELDWFDVFFTFGFPGILIVIVSVFIIRMLINKENSIHKILLFFSLIYSFVVGHVFNNPLSSMVFAIILAGLVRNIRLNDGDD